MTASDVGWFAEDGLMRLDPADDREPFPGQLSRTVKNENGIYFAGHHALLRCLLSDADMSAWANLFRGAASRLQSRSYPGIFYRHPGNVLRDEAHDNYVALAGISALLDLEYHRPILAHGEHYWWCYNTLEPGKFSWKHRRQPGEVAYYYICNRKPAPLFSFLWMVGGLLVNAHQKRDSKHNNPSTTLLAFHRLAVMNELMGWQYRPVQWIFHKVRNYWHKKIKAKYGSIAGVYKAYFQEPEHPMHELARRYAELHNV